VSVSSVGLGVAGGSLSLGEVWVWVHSAGVRGEVAAALPSLSRGEGAATARVRTYRWGACAGSALLSDAEQSAPRSPQPPS
jgi:hypothetical protein